MSSLRILFSRILATFRKSARERELDQELRAHIDLLVDENLRKGMSPTDARHAALRAFGGIEQTKEVYRERRGLVFFETLLQDIRCAFRMMRQNRVFTAVAVLSLALGIGANTAIFSLVDGVLLKSLPVDHPEQLLQVTFGGEESFTNPLWEQLREQQDVFSGVFATSDAGFNLSAGGQEHYATGFLASGDYFRTLGIRPVLGRLLTPVDDHRGCPAVAVLSYGFWQSHYAGDGGVVGRKIVLDGHPFDIIGVAEPGFNGVMVGRRFEIAAPICVEAIERGADSMLDHRSSWWLGIIGRPKPGMGPKQVAARLKTLAPRITQATTPQDWQGELRRRYLSKTLDAIPAARGLSFLRDPYGDALIILMVVVGVVLFIACANIANLLLARAALRRKEIAVRLAIGAARGRLVRQLLTESLLLSLLGAALGILFANWGSAVLVRYLSARNNPVFLDVSLNLRILGFTAAVAVATGILFGMAPAWRATRVPLNAAIKENARGLTGGRARLGFGKMLVAFQVALSLVLLVGAGLLSATFWKLITQDPGFDRNNVLLVQVDFQNARYPKDRLPDACDQILAALRALPGVRSASYSSITPIAGSFWNEIIHVDGYTPKNPDDALLFMNGVSPEYFQTTGTPILVGRDFSTGDSKNAPPVTIVNETASRRFFHGVNPIGKGYRMESSDGKPGQLIEIVGVVKDAKYGEMREPIKPTGYVPSVQTEYFNANTFALRTNGPASSLIAPVKKTFESINKNIYLEFTTLATQVNESLNRERLLATLSGFFGALALLLAAIGLYGVMSYTVARRRNEIGIRMALGAEQKTIQWMVLREVLFLVGAGLLIGFAAATAATRLLTSMLYGLTPTDPTTLAFAGITLLTVAALAGYLPARRAAKLDPMTTLREE
ncbi:MAG TPA: ABC transporter permease [Bryobacteraceae bacterium]|nr:ABC transporter permease [Bryobacteraceae bacterium]